MKLVNRLLSFPVLAWRRLAAPLLPPACRFHPSCSAYALEALERLSWPRAAALIVWRVARCNPLCRGGYDPVPAPKSMALAEAARSQCREPQCASRDAAHASMGRP